MKNTVYIDKNCVYIPDRYRRAGHDIVIVEHGHDVDNHVSQAQVESPVEYPYDKSMAYANHQGKALCGRTYDVYQMYPREFIGTAKCEFVDYSDVLPKKNNSWW